MSSPGKHTLIKPRKKVLTAEQKVEALKTGIKRIQDGESVVQVWIDVGKKYGIHKATLQSWFKMVSTAPVDDWPELLKSNYKGRTSTAELSPEAWEFFLRTYQGMKEVNSAKAHKETVIKGKQFGWKVPSERTLQRRLKAAGLKRNPNERYSEIDI